MRADLSAVTVHATGRRVDVLLPNTVPIAELTPTIAELCGTAEDDVRPAAWTLSRVGQEPFSLSATLADAAVVDGEVLHLVDPGVWSSPIASRLDEPVVSTVAGEQEWSSRRLIDPVLGVLGTVLLLVAAGFVAVRPSLRHDAGPALLAAVAAILAAAYLLPAGERRRFSRPALAAGDWGLAVVTGWALAGGRLDAAGGCGAAIALVVTVLASMSILAPVAAGAALAGSFGALGFVLAALGLRPVQAAAVVVVAGTVLARGLPRLLSHRLSRRSVGAEAEQVAEFARASRSLLVSLTSGCVAAVVAGSAVLAAAGDPLTIALAAVAGGMLALRALTYRFAREAIAPAIGACLTFAGALLGASAAAPAPGAGALLLILTGVGTTLLTFVPRGEGVRRATMWWTLLDVCIAPLTLYSLGFLDALSRTVGGLFG
ncbi:EsaB/YukD family protein [Actinoallomurus sp. NBC_01490]|uniref:EsaB/YukD family protein n=1 Tax=Actinoallomurus sp. NBC_01490 TaxID=2903557 RepID=UPI002E34CD8A|nr:EsaB/YukD family protein [Actinoallomurus sp. NBC_01490]